MNYQEDQRNDSLEGPIRGVATETSVVSNRHKSAWFVWRDLFAASRLKPPGLWLSRVTFGSLEGPIRGVATETVEHSLPQSPYLAFGGTYSRRRD